MLDFLLNNSITIIFLLTIGFLGYSEYRRYLQRKEITPSEFRSLVRSKINEIGSGLLTKLATAVVIALIVSLVSFRELFVMDVFHTVFLTLLLARPVSKKLKAIFE